MKRCAACGLPHSFPGVRFNAHGVCNYCVYHSLYRHREDVIKQELKDEFNSLIDKTKREKHRYDCIVAYSGGKDSTFLLKFLKTKFGLRNILAHTLDNGFTSPQALRNIRTVTRALGIESRITRPSFDVLRDVFRFALVERIPYPKEILSMMSQVCATCIGMVFGTTLNLAVRHKIPLLFIGFTPGQYPAISLENFFKVDSCMFLSDRVYRDDPVDIFKIVADPIRERFGSRVQRLFFKSQYVPEGMPVPKVLFPFHALLDYDEKRIRKEIAELGWVSPKDTDTCSTNCLLNSAGNISCLKRFGYHPYAGELSYLVRQGRISRAEALAAETVDRKSPVLRETLRKLRVTSL